MGYEVYRYIRIPGLRAHSRGPCFRPLDIGRVQGLGLIVKEVWEPQPSSVEMLSGYLLYGEVVGKHCGSRRFVLS